MTKMTLRRRREIEEGGGAYLTPAPLPAPATPFPAAVTTAPAALPIPDVAALAALPIPALAAPRPLVSQLCCCGAVFAEAGSVFFWPIGVPTFFTVDL